MRAANAQPIMLVQADRPGAAKPSTTIAVPDRLKKAEQELDQISAAFKQKDVSDEKLQAMRNRLDFNQAELLNLIGTLRDGQKAAKARLDQLGAAPKVGAGAASVRGGKQFSYLNAI